MTADIVATDVVKSVAAQPVALDDGPLSPWWLRTILIVMVVGFAGLAAVTHLAYRNAPPIPAQVVDAQGKTVMTSEDILDGQTVFLRYGLMANGSIWGHGAYLGPDYAAETLHRIGEHTAEAIALQKLQQASDCADPWRTCGGNSAGRGRP